MILEPWVIFELIVVPLPLEYMPLKEPVSVIFAAYVAVAPDSVLDHTYSPAPSVYMLAYCDRRELSSSLDGRNQSSYTVPSFSLLRW